MATLFDPEALSSILPVWGSLHSFDTLEDDTDDTGGMDDLSTMGKAGLAAPSEESTDPAPVAAGGGVDGRQQQNTSAQPTRATRGGRTFQLTPPDISSLPSADRAGKLQHRLDAEYQPRPQGTKETLLKAATLLAPMLIARAAGGPAAGAGAAQGTSQYLTTEREQGNLRRRELIQQSEGAQGRVEQEYQAGMRGQVAQAQLEGLTGYRDAQVLLKKEANANAALKNANQYDSTLRKSGQRINKQTGEVENIPRNELPLHEQQWLDLQDAREDLARAQAAGVPERIAVAKQNAQRALATLNLSIERLQLARENTAAANYGTDLAGNPLPGAPLGEDGQPVGSRFRANVVPTTLERNRAGQAGAIKQSGQNIIDSLVDSEGKPTALADKLGPILGRIQNLGQLLEIQDPDIAKYAAELASYAALQPGLHGFYGRNALVGFEKIVGGLPRKPENIIAGIRGIESGAAQSMQDMGTPKLAKGAGTSTQLTKNKAKVTHRFNPQTGKIEAVK